VSPLPSLIDLLTSSLATLVNQLRSWGLISLVLSAALLASTVVLIGFGVAAGIGMGLIGTEAPRQLSTALTVSMAGIYLSLLAFWTVGFQVLYAGLLRLAFRELDDGTPASLRDLPSAMTTDLLSVLAVVIFSSVVGLIGACLCIIPGMIAGAVLVWALPLVVDRGMDPLAAMKESFDTFWRYPWWCIGLMLLCVLTTVLIGQLLPIVGFGLGYVLQALIMAKAYRAVFPSGRRDS
jgi:uncharacterized membrane protein